MKYFTMIFLLTITTCITNVLTQSTINSNKFLNKLETELNKVDKKIDGIIDEAKINIAPADSLGNDLLYLVGSKNPIKGKLVSVDTKTISFTDNAGVNYNLTKKEVRFIKTADGRTMNFNVDEDEDYNSTDKVEKDSGGMSGWAVVGIVLTVLLTIGLIGALAR